MRYLLCTILLCVLVGCEKHSQANGILANLDDFKGNRTLTGVGQMSENGQLTFPYAIATENLDFVAKIRVESQSNFGLCRLGADDRGTMLLLQDSIVTINRLDNGVAKEIYSYKMPFKVIEGRTYVLRMYKENKNLVFSVLSERGELYVNKAQYDFSHDFGRSWGYPSVFCLDGEIKVEDAFLKNTFQEKVSMAVFGDSLIEGWGIIDSLELRYAALIRDYLGSENVYISGRGGDNTTILLERYEVELKSIDSKYVILAIGTNDHNLQLFKSNIKALINKTRQSNQIPILVTITPREGIPIEEMNSFIRTSGELYIDMNKAVNDGREGYWKPELVNEDEVHPNVLGNEKMFRRIFFDLPFLFSTKQLN